MRTIHKRRGRLWQRVTLPMDLPSFTVTPGSTTTYYLYIFGNNCADLQNTYSAPVTVIPPGDNCNCPQNLASLTSPYNGTTSGYADDISICHTGSPDRIFYISVPDGYTIDIGNLQRLWFLCLHGIWQFMSGQHYNTIYDDPDVDCIIHGPIQQAQPKQFGMFRMAMRWITALLPLIGQFIKRYKVPFAKQVLLFVREHHTTSRHW